MKIAVTSTGTTLDDAVESRFGRCAYFLIIDTEAMDVEPLENPNIALGGGAGIQSAQLLSEKGVKSVLTGNCGPNAFTVFGQTGIEVIVGVSGKVKDAVEKFKNGAYSSASGPNVASHFGMGGGRGMGRGGGIGRGSGMGRGRGMGMRSSQYSDDMQEQYPPAKQDSSRELEDLKQQAEQLEKQKKELNNKINKMDKGSRHKAVAVVDTEKCAGCGICVDVCPVGAIEVDQTAVINEEICTGCARCVAECPNAAIVIAQKKV